MVLNIISGEIEIEDVGGFLDCVKKISTKYNVIVQVMDSNKVAGARHLECAVQKAIQSTEQGTNISNDLALEVLLYASGQRHIKKALKMGVSVGKNNVAIVIIGDSDKACHGASQMFKEMLKEKPTVEYSQSKKKEIMKFFGITEAEIKAAGKERIQDLVIERVVLLDILKKPPTLR